MTNELLIVGAVLVVLLAIGLGTASGFGWKPLSGVGIAIAGFVLFYIVTNAPDIWDQIIGRGRKSSSQLNPESECIVEMTDSLLRSTQPDGTVEEIAWDELTGFDIETNSLGPFAPDVFWILHGDGRRCIIPQGATGDTALLERLQQLPRFDNEKFIEAMASTSDATFKIWQKTNTEQAGAQNP